MRTVIKNGTVVTVEKIFEADVLIEDETIVSISDQIIPLNNDKVINAAGQYVFPGSVDVHTHLSNRGNSDDFESGTKAAAIGGVTSLINMTDMKKGQSLLDYLQEWKLEAEPSLIDYGFHLIIGGDVYEDRILEELPVLAEQKSTSIKLFMANKGTDMVDDSQMYKVMKKAAELGLIVLVHAENGDLVDNMVSEAVKEGHTDTIYHAYTRPPIVESEATARALAIAELTGACVYIVHISCADALQKVKEAKQRGVKVYAETLPQFLVLDEESLKLPDFEGGKYVCSPPLREKWNQEELWKGIENGLISTIGSDHVSVKYHGKKTRGKNDFSKIAHGMPGIEDRFSLLYHFGVNEGKISLQKFVEIMSASPAEIFGLVQKGAIVVGMDADIVIFDPERSRIISEKTQHQNVDYNPYENMAVQGAITYVLSHGQVIVENGILMGEPGKGRHLDRY